jgi:hypothetical protein
MSSFSIYPGGFSSFKMKVYSMMTDTIVIHDGRSQILGQTFFGNIVLKIYEEIFVSDTSLPDYHLTTSILFFSINKKLFVLSFKIISRY